MVERFPTRRPDGPLARLHQLEWRYDGPVPAEVLSGLDATPAELTRRRAAANGALADRLARDAVHSLAAARCRMSAEQLRRLEQHPAAARLAASRRAGLTHRGEGPPPP